MASYDAILFDFDGVLVDSEPVHFAAWNAALESFGVEMSWDSYLVYIGRSDRQMIDDLCKLKDPPIPFEEMWARFPAKAEEYRRRMREEMPCPAETRALLRKLSAYPMAVVTSSARSEVEPLLELAGIRDCFAAVVGAEDVPRHKPDPLPYVEAARRLGATRPLVVEDSDAGEKAGLGAGFDVLRVNNCGAVPAEVLKRLGDGL